MVKIREVIVVEGRYDKNTLSQVVDATILETKGFGIFKDKAQLRLLRRAAQARGLIVLTDSDGAGFVIRNYLRGVHIIHHPLLTCHKAAQAGQRLGEGPHNHVHLVLQTKIAGGASAALADDTQAVGVVHHHPGAEFPGQGYDLRQIGNVSSHGKHAVCDNQAAPALGSEISPPVRLLTSPVWEL